MIPLTVKKLVTIGFVGLLALPSCGGDDAVSAQSYVDDLCSAIGEWLNTFQEQAAEVQSTLTPETSPAEGKEKLTTFLDESIEATDQVIEDIDAAGVPDVENGEEISSKISELFGKTKEALEEAQANVEDLPTDDPTAFREQTTEISETLRAQGDSLSESLDEVQNSEELEEAAQESEECEELGNLS